ETPDFPGQTIAVLAATATAADAQATWPTVSWDALRRADVLAWSIPREYGGQQLGVIEILEGQAKLASACLTTAFILSQGEAAGRRITDHGKRALGRELPRRLACGGHFATVGLSQLTASRQHTQPALRAKLDHGSLIVDGQIPWVTGAAQADHVIIGAA